MTTNLLDLMTMIIKFIWKVALLNSKKIFIIIYLSISHILFLHSYSDVPRYLTFCRIHLQTLQQIFISFYYNNHFIIILLEQLKSILLKDFCTVLKIYNT
jgi:hypothetical protein